MRSAVCLRSALPALARCAAAVALAAPLAMPLAAQTLPTTALGTFAGVSYSGFVDAWQMFTPFKNEVYFAADGGDGAGTELWRTDGTPGGTVRVADLNPGPGGADPQGFAVFRGHLYFTATDGTAARLYRTDGVNPPAAFAPRGVYGLVPTSVGLFGTSVEPGLGTEPWVTDGTSFSLLKNIGPAAQNGTPAQTGGTFAFEERGTTVFFGANDRTGVSGQLWKTLGTEASTEKVLTLALGMGYPAYCNYQVPGPPTEFFAFQNTLHFVATWYDNVGPDPCFQSGQDYGYLGALWTSTGSPGLPAGTRALASVLGVPGARVRLVRASPRWRETSATGPVGSTYLVEGQAQSLSGEFTVFGPSVLYAFDGSSLTPLFAGEYGPASSPLVRLGDVGGRRVFARVRNAPGGNFGDYLTDVMATDGTPGGTTTLATYSKAARPGDAGEGAVWFPAYGADGWQLYRTDGTAAPTQASALVHDANTQVEAASTVPGAALALHHNGFYQGTLYAVGTPGTRIRRQPLAGTGAASATLSDGTATVTVGFDVQAIAGSGAMRVELLDHAITPLEGGAPPSGVLRHYVRIERPTSITALDTRLTLGYTDADLAAAGVADESALAVWKYSGGVWTKLAVAARDLAANTLRVDGITSFSDFAIADGAATLPVELASFTGLASGSTARLSWTTASETNNAGFAVEQQRASDGGTTWTERGFVAGHGTTTEQHTYAFDVTGLAAGTYRFRLRQTDTDGAVRYSAVIAVEIRVGTGTDGDEARAVRVTLLGQRAVRVETAVPQAVDVSVYDVLGRRVSTARADVSGTAEVALPTGLASGAYVVRLVGERFAETRRLVVR